jgi:phage terminase large subunit-like protein
VNASVTLVEPAYFTHPDYADSLGPEVADLAEIVGFAADPEQRLVLDAMFGLDRAGRRIAFEVAVIGARQNIKTGLFKIAALGEAFIAEVPLLVWSAHEFPTAQEAFRDLSELIESSPDLDREVKHIHRGNGDEAIELLNGCRIKFKARTKSGGRGLSGKRVVLDEAFALQPTHMGALLPMLSAQDEPQVWYGSSAGLADSEVLRGIRDRGRVGSRSMVYVEWCAPKGGCAESSCDHHIGATGCVLDDESRWQMANPQMGRRIKIDTIRNERLALPPEEFARERLGWWDEPGSLEHIFGAEKWARCAIPSQDEPPTAGIALGVAVSIDRAWSSISAAVPLPGRELIGLLNRQRGTDWLVAETKRLQDKLGCQVGIDSRGPAADLIEPMRAAGVNLSLLSTTEVLDASAAFYDKVQTTVIAHMGHPELEDAVRGAQRRSVSDRWAVGRRVSTADVSPLEGAIIADHLLGFEYDVLESVL